MKNVINRIFAFYLVFLINIIFLFASDVYFCFGPIGFENKVRTQLSKINKLANNQEVFIYLKEVKQNNIISKTATLFYVSNNNLFCDLIVNDTLLKEKIKTTLNPKLLKHNKNIWFKKDQFGPLENLADVFYDFNNPAVMYYQKDLKTFFNFRYSKNELSEKKNYFQRKKFVEQLNIIFESIIIN